MKKCKKLIFGEHVSPEPLTRSAPGYMYAYIYQTINTSDAEMILAAEGLLSMETSAFLSIKGSSLQILEEDNVLETIDLWCFAPTSKALDLKTP